MTLLRKKIDVKSIRKTTVSDELYYVITANKSVSLSPKEQHRIL